MVGRLFNQTQAQAAAADSTLFGNMPVADSYAALVPKFAMFHQDPANVAAHLITTPLGFVAAFCIFNRLTNSSGLGAMVAAFYVLALVPVVSPAVFLGTAIITAAVVVTAARLRLSVIMATILLIASYFIQDLAHYLTGEATFQSTYSAGGHIDFTRLDFWAAMFFEHCFFLLPLCVEVALPLSIKTSAAALPSFVLALHQHMYVVVPLLYWVSGNFGIDSDSGFFPFDFVKSRVLRCELKNSGDLANLASIRAWAIAQKPPEKSTSHWWYSKLPTPQRQAFSDVAHCDTIMNMFYGKFDASGYVVEVVDGMNEVYISAPVAKGTSDEVFYTEHVDGPFGLFPFCSVFRCIVGMDANKAFRTHFPMAAYDHAVATGDVLGFDFHREPHFLTREDPTADERRQSDGRRVVLKVHYCVYPKGFYALGKLLHGLSVLYNLCFRALFLATIKPPETAWEIFSGQVVVQSTRGFNAFQRAVGFQNALYLGVLALLASPWLLNDYRVFLVGTSYVHYLRYIATYYHRKEVSFEAFKRDVLLFKSLALAQLGYLYLQHVDLQALDGISLGMIVSGYTLSLLATNALGLDRTYFGVELGVCEPKWITAFPYGVIPHPMIVSQILALGGFLKLAAFRVAWPWLVPGHMALYFIHMLQEHFDIHCEGKVSLAAIFSMGGRTEQVLRKQKLN